MANQLLNKADFEDISDLVNFIIKNAEVLIAIGFSEVELRDLKQKSQKIHKKIAPFV